MRNTFIDQIDGPLDSFEYVILLNEIQREQPKTGTNIKRVVIRTIIV